MEMTGAGDAFIVTDLGYGDAGKGSVTDFLARTRNIKTVVRFNGGPQASHNVITPEGVHHAFHQFGSASFVAGVRTHLSRFMLVSPLLLWNEADALAVKGVQDPMSHISIDGSAKIITPYHEAANRIREAVRGDGRHGSCGLGIGETMSDSIAHPDETLTATDLASSKQAWRRLEQIRGRKLQELKEQIAFLKGCADLEGYPELARDIETLSDPCLSEAVVDFYATFCAKAQIVDQGFLGGLLEQGGTIFEGAQGVLLDEWYGFHPYTTWSTTTNANANTLLQELDFRGSVTRLGLLRAYATRHGAGPFVTEDTALSGSLADPHNPYNAWQQTFRVGHFDEVAARYALDIAGDIDALAISNLDEMIGQTQWSVCTGYAKKDGTRLASLQRCAAPDLAFQSRLTEMLLTCTPLLEPFQSQPVMSKDIAQYLEKIEGALHRKIHIASSGPTAFHKQWLVT